MGGLNSGRWAGYRKRKTVEDCLALDLFSLMRRAGKIKPGNVITGQLSWASSSGAGSSSQYSAKLTSGASWLRLQYDWQGQQVDYSISMVSTRPFFGGQRWWLVCPLVVNGKACARRVGKLYLPPGAQWFGCRECHQLTYRSSQQSHRLQPYQWPLAWSQTKHPRRLP
jgi:hypothetical protein